MSVAAESLFTFDNSFVRELAGLYEPWQAAAVSNPELLVLNEELAAELGVPPESLRTQAGIAFLVGNAILDGMTPVAQAYAGHQFGGYSPRLGDGRALLLGEVIDVDGHRRDIHLKGSGRTPFSRGGDGKAAIGPMLREHLIGEAMHALGIPTTRALAVVATGEQIARDTLLPGALLTRVAASHLRVGTFQYAAGLDDLALLRRLADHAITRHHPAAASAANTYLALLDSVIDVQASLVAQWMRVGFIHGVMNTDNMTISGQTIDYGPCAFLDSFDPATVFSSIDHGARYAFGNQPRMAQWNLARFAEALLALIDDDQETAVAAATALLHEFPERFRRHWTSAMRAKLGLPDGPLADESIVDDLLALMHAQQLDFTSTFRALSASLTGDGPARSACSDPQAFDAWHARWTALLPTEPGALAAVARGMDAVNPIYIPRNHLVEEALAAATAGDMAPYHEIVGVVTKPFIQQQGRERYAEPAPSGFGEYRTFCGT